MPSGDLTDLYLRVDGMSCAVETAIEQLAEGRVADAQVTLGEASNIERLARIEDALNLMAEGMAMPSVREDSDGNA